jgi:hypothetical protein
MSRRGWFDSTGIPLGWFDDTGQADGWFDVTNLDPSTGGVTNTGVFPGAGSFTLTGYAPTVGQTRTVNPGVGTINLVGYAPTVAQSDHHSVSPGAGTLTLTGYAPTVAQNFTLTLTLQQAINLEAVIRLHGLIDPLVVSNTARGDGTVTQTLSGTTTVTVHTTSKPTTGSPTAAQIDLLARHYALIDDMVEQATTRSDGTLTQTVATIDSDTTITTI